MMKTDLSEVIEGMLAELPPRQKKLSKCVLELVTSVSIRSMRLARNLESLGSGSDQLLFQTLVKLRHPCQQFSERLSRGGLLNFSLTFTIGVDDNQPSTHFIMEHFTII